MINYNKLYGCGSKVKFISSDSADILNKISTVVCLEQFSEARFNPDVIYMTTETFKNGVVHTSVLIRCVLLLNDKLVSAMSKQEKDKVAANKSLLLLVFGVDGKSDKENITPFFHLYPITGIAK